MGVLSPCSSSAVGWVSQGVQPVTVPHFMYSTNRFVFIFQCNEICRTSEEIVLQNVVLSTLPTLPVRQHEIGHILQILGILQYQ